MDFIIMIVVILFMLLALAILAPVCLAFVVAIAEEYLRVKEEKEWIENKWL